MAETKATFTTTPGASGALFTPVPLERRVNIYPMLETELTTFGLLTNLLSGALAVAGAVLGFLASIAWDMATSSEQAKRTIGWPIVVVCVVAIIGCVVVATLAYRKRETELAKIKSESRVIQGSL